MPRFNYLCSMINGKSSPRGQGSASQEQKDAKITNVMLAKWFKYSSPNSFNGSKAKDDILNGVKEVIKYLNKRHIPPDK